ncbi:MAG: AtpZ/AtpI family protein [SAR202 cluster bacterium]|nr:AtpZ/AtpI family protein [SAR202 cluster bacterium]
MSRWTVALRVTGLGWYVATCVVLGVVGGYWLDRLLGTTPLFILVLTVLGSIVAFYGIYKMIVPVLYGDKNWGEDRQGSRTE